MALWTPEYIDTALWLDAADSSTITESGGAVSVWADKSSNDVQLSDINGPPTYTRTINSLGAIDLCPSGVPASFVYESIATTVNTAWLFIVAAHDTWTEGANTNGVAGLFNLTIDGTNNRFYGGYYSGYANGLGVRLGLTDGSCDVVGYVGTAGEPFMMFAGRNYQTGGKLYVDGTLIDSNDLLQNTLPVTSQFVFIGNNTADNFWDGLVGEVILLRDEPAATDRQTIEGYLAHKWGLTANLPVDHTYKTTAPLAPYSISGTILGADGNPAARTVRIHDRSTGALLQETTSDATTGTYDLGFLANDEVQRIVLADEVDLYNDIVDRVIPG